MGIHDGHREKMRQRFLKKITGWMGRFIKRWFPISPSIFEKTSLWKALRGILVIMKNIFPIRFIPWPVFISVSFSPSIALSMRKSFCGSSRLLFLKLPRSVVFRRSIPLTAPLRKRSEKPLLNTEKIFNKKSAKKIFADFFVTYNAQSRISQF